MCGVCVCGVCVCGVWCGVSVWSMSVSVRCGMCMYVCQAQPVGGVSGARQERPSSPQRKQVSTQPRRRQQLQSSHLSYLSLPRLIGATKKRKVQERSRTRSAITVRGKH